MHGPRETGKSKLINWTRRIAEEALEWQREEHVHCAAFQNRVAHAMGGTTLHSGGDIALGGRAIVHPTQTHTDIDLLFTRNQHLRCVC